MKRNIILIFLCLFTSFAGQSKEPQSVTWGIRAGFNVSNFYYDGDLDFDPIPGFSAGVVADIPIKDWIGINTGLYFSTKGGETSMYLGDYDNVYDMECDATVQSMYLEIPVLASFRFYPSDKNRFELNVGPYFACGVGGETEATVTGEYQREKVTVIVKEDTFGNNKALDKRFDLGWALGAGFTHKKVYLGLQYEIGFLNLLEDDEYDICTNGNFSISVGYNF